MSPNFQMKMATALEDFSSWLSRTLEELNTDESVFGSYIQGILDGDEPPDEKLDALQELLRDIVENDEALNKICAEIMEKWQHHKPKEPPPQQASEDVDAKLVKLLESQSLATTKQKKYTAEEKKIREAILSQYSQMTDDEDEAEDGPHQGGDQKPNGLEKNTNVQSVLHAEKVKREQAKLDSQKKKEKDKEDREKQKQLREEKKEKRKTQKQERRR